MSDGEDGTAKDWSYTSHVRADLRGVDLSGADLRRAIFDGADLEGAVGAVRDDDDGDLVAVDDALDRLGRADEERLGRGRLAEGQVLPVRDEGRVG